jgi:hypothetical protein
MEHRRLFFLKLVVTFIAALDTRTSLNALGWGFPPTPSSGAQPSSAMSDDKPAATALPAAAAATGSSSSTTLAAMDFTSTASGIVPVL